MALAAQGRTVTSCMRQQRAGNGPVLSRCQPGIRRPARQCMVRAAQGDASNIDGNASSFGQQERGDLGFKAFVSEAEWRKIDKKVNKYPGQRTFTAIGMGGDDFRVTMLSAVESVVGTVHMECVSERPSSGGKYVSVRIGPVWVENADQVVQVFNNMREDSRLKWYM